LNYLLEICLFGCIIYLSYKLYFFKKQLLNAESLNKENTFLKNQLTDFQKYFSQQKELLEESKQNLIVKEQALLNSNRELEKRLSEEIESRKKILNQKKSSEVRLGHIAETLAPFLDQFDFEPEQCCFLGKPIDYVSFGDDEITFIEVKSGKSQLSSKQKNIRDQIKNNNVTWKEIRIK